MAGTGVRRSAICSIPSIAAVSEARRRAIESTASFTSLCIERFSRERQRSVDMSAGNERRSAGIDASGKDVAGSDGEPFTRLPWVTQPVAELALTTLLHASVTADGMMDTGLAGTVFALTSSAVATAGAALAAHKPCVTSSA